MTKLSYSKRNENRILQIATRHQSCRDVLGILEKNKSIYAFTGGQFCFINVLQYIIEHIGKSKIAIMTWSAADADLKHAYNLLKDNNIDDIKFIFDFSFPRRHPDYCDTLLTQFPGCCRATNLHAKMAIVYNEDWCFTIRTSMNLNFNKRFENVEVCEDEEMCEFHKNIFNEIWDKSSVISKDKSAYEMKKTKNDITFNNEVEHSFDFETINDINI